MYRPLLGLWAVGLLVSPALADRNDEVLFLLRTANDVSIDSRRRDAVDSQRLRKEALALTEQAYALQAGATGEDAGPTYLTLATMAQRAYCAEAFGKAANYAVRALDEVSAREPGGPEWAVGTAVQHAHLVLGKLALRDGDVDEAEEHLLEAGSVERGVTLTSFGPNMALADLLLERGRTAAVLEYFKLCRRFWDLGHDRLDEWSVIVANGGRPDFGANLAYGH